MKKFRKTLLVAIVGLGAVNTTPCEAKGVMKGAAKGAFVGHVLGHHAKAGAAIGAIHGHHKAKMAAKKH